MFEWQRVPILMFKLSLLKFPIVSSCIFDDLYIITVNLLIYIYILYIHTVCDNLSKNFPLSTWTFCVHDDLLQDFLHDAYPIEARRNKDLKLLTCFNDISRPFSKSSYIIHIGSNQIHITTFLLSCSC